MDAAAAGHALLDAEEAWASLGTECTIRADHVAVRFAAAPLATSGNLFRAIRLPAGADPDAFLSERLEEAGAWGWPACRLQIDDRTFPASLGDWLGSQEFLPREYLGFAARARDVVAGARVVPVRRASIVDAPAVEALLATEQSDLRLSAEVSAANLQLARVRLWRPDVCAWIAELDERPAGHAVVWGAGTFAYVRRLFVPEPCRGRGVATALLRAVAHAVGNAGTVACFADAEAGLPEFYRARGFAAVTRRESWTRRADD